MKDSGVKWIGEIPINWQVKKVKHNFFRKKGKPNSENFDILTLARSGIKIRDISTGEGQIAADYSNYNPVAPGDILINPMDLVSGDNSNISEVCGVISPAYVNLQANKDTNPYFYNYYFKLQYWLGSFFTHGKGVSYENRWTLNDETIKNFPIVYPSKEEQEKIVQFLNEKLNRISKLIKDTQQSIEELKKYKETLITEVVTKGLDKNGEMKDSGIEWMGYIPVKWSVLKFGNVINIKSNLVNPNDFPNFQQVSPDDIEKDTAKLIKFKTVKESGVSSSNYYFYKGQILYSKIRPKLNKVVIAPFDGLCSADMYPIDTTENSEFIIYLMMSYYFKHQVSMITADRVKMPKINREELSNLIIVLPNRFEQNQIVSYLNDKLSGINIIINDKEKVIQELEQYKKSLIYEYVTGKKEV